MTGLELDARAIRPSIESIHRVAVNLHEGALEKPGCTVRSDAVTCTGGHIPHTVQIPAGGFPGGSIPAVWSMIEFRTLDRSAVFDILIADHCTSFLQGSPTYAAS